MKKFLLFIVFFLPVFSSIKAQNTIDTIVVFFKVECQDTSFILDVDRVVEGQPFTMRDKTLPANAHAAQQAYDALVSSYFMFEIGSINQNLKVIFRMRDIDCATGKFKGDTVQTQPLKFFFRQKVDVYNWDSTVWLNPPGHPFWFNNPDNFVLVFKKTPKLRNFLVHMGLHPQTVLGFAYNLNPQQYQINGVQYKSEGNDSLVIEFEHFSALVGGDRSVLANVSLLDFDDEIPIASAYSLISLYPNPVNSESIAKYYLSQSGEVELKVFDVLGKEVEILFSGIKAKGWHENKIDLKNYSSGIYFVVLKTSFELLTLKLVVLK